MGDPGSTAWMFQRRGVILVDKATAPDEDALLETALEAGADDLSDAESHWEITTHPATFNDVKGALESGGMELASAEVTMAPTVTVPVDGAQARSVLNLVEALEDNEDVQAVYANFDIPEEVLAEAG
jgi:transcriptional/translational regulatory protein YebC/TACO1